jgi:hypothetical protein
MASSASARRSELGVVIGERLVHATVSRVAATARFSFPRKRGVVPVLAQGVPASATVNQGLFWEEETSVV